MAQLLLCWDIVVTNNLMRVTVETWNWPHDNNHGNKEDDNFIDSKDINQDETS